MISKDITMTSETETALEPCPFCASANIDPEGWMSRDGDGTPHTGPACDDCGASADSVERWNTRPALSRAPEAGREGRLRKAVAHVIDVVDFTADRARVLAGTGDGVWLPEDLALAVCDLADAYNALSPPSTGGGALHCPTCGAGAETVHACKCPSPEMGEISRGKGIYVASRASLAERGAMWRALRAAGHPVVSTWIDEDGPGETADFGDLWQRIEREVTGAERLVAYLEPDDFPVRGVLIEIGMALAAGVPVFIVAPGVALAGRSFRPLGSWIKHPLVSFCETVEDAILSKLKENGLSREGLGGSARASRGAACPSDCAEGDARLSGGAA